MDDGDIEEDVEGQARREFLEKMFERYLTERERKILVLYYGLTTGCQASSGSTTTSRKPWA